MSRTVKLTCHECKMQLMANVDVSFHQFSFKCPRCSSTQVATIKARPPATAAAPPAPRAAASAQQAPAGAPQAPQQAPPLPQQQQQQQAPGGRTPTGGAAGVAQQQQQQQLAQKLAAQQLLQQQLEQARRQQQQQQQAPLLGSSNNDPTAQQRALLLLQQLQKHSQGQQLQQLGAATAAGGSVAGSAGGAGSASLAGLPFPQQQGLQIPQQQPGTQVQQQQQQQQQQLMSSSRSQQDIAAYMAIFQARAQGQHSRQQQQGGQVLATSGGGAGTGVGGGGGSGVGATAMPAMQQHLAGQQPQEATAAKAVGIPQAMMRAPGHVGSPPGVMQPAGMQQHAEEEAEDGDVEEGAVESYLEYVPAKWRHGYRHPHPVVESVSLSAVAPPDITYRLHINDAIADGRLSIVQAEAVVYCCQRHEQHLATSPSSNMTSATAAPTSSAAAAAADTGGGGIGNGGGRGPGPRAGFFLGDGAGVGKGRTIAALVLENWRAGRRKAVWVSTGTDLHADARRDLDDLGARHIPLHVLSKLPYSRLTSKAVNIQEGVLFVTYSTLTSASEKGASRLRQLMQWAGDDFDGLIAFDECHKAKNLVPSSKSAGGATKTGQAVLELQTKLTDARVLYCSATGVSELRNIGYMVRLGLWGPSSSSFPLFQDLLQAISSRGVGALEVVAMDMKARGMYLCRTLSYVGAEFVTVSCALPDVIAKQYEAAAMMWCKLRREFAAADAKVNDGAPKGRGGGLMWMRFWGSHQRFFRMMCIAAKVPDLVAHANKALEDGHCVVVGLQSTGEMATEYVVGKRGTEEMDDFVSGPKELLSRLVEEGFPVPDMDEEEEWQALEAMRAARAADTADSRGRRAATTKTVNYTAPSDNSLLGPATTSSGSSSGSSSEGWDGGGGRSSRRGGGRRRGRPAASTGSSTSESGESSDASETSSASKTASDNDGGSADSSDAAGGGQGGATSGKGLEDGGSADAAADEARRRSGGEACSSGSAGGGISRAPSGKSRRSQGGGKSGGGGGASAGGSQGGGGGPQATGVAAAKPRRRRKLTREEKEERREARRALRRDMVAQRDRLLEEISKMQLPPNPLDDIIERMGGIGKVAEMTGRSGRLVRDPTSGTYKYQRRNQGLVRITAAPSKATAGGSSGGSEGDDGDGADAAAAAPATSGVPLEAVNLHEKELFVSGAKLVAVISEAASAGISLHADRRFANTRRRVHFTLELPWSADKAIQQLGRSHRANQACAPLYCLLTTPLGGERRFASAVAKRIESMGALTQGDRRAGGGMALDAHNYEDNWGQRALRRTYSGLLEDEPPLVDPLDPSSRAPPPRPLPQDARNFLGRCRAHLLNVGLLQTRPPQPPTHHHFLPPAAAAAAAPAAPAATGVAGMSAAPAAGAHPSASQQAQQQPQPGQDGTAGVGAEKEKGVTAAVSEEEQWLTAPEGAPARRVKMLDRDRGDVAKFLNRLLGLAPCVQQPVFEMYQGTLTSIVDTARKEGRFDSGIQDVSGTSVRVVGEPQRLFRDEVSGASTMLYTVEVDRGVDWALAQRLRVTGQTLAAALAALAAEQLQGEEDGMVVEEEEAGKKAQKEEEEGTEKREEKEEDGKGEDDVAGAEEGKGAEDVEMGEGEEQPIGGEEDGKEGGNAGHEAAAAGKLGADVSKGKQQPPPTEAAAAAADGSAAAAEGGGPAMLPRADVAMPDVVESHLPLQQQQAPEDSTALAASTAVAAASRDRHMQQQQQQDGVSPVKAEEGGGAAGPAGAAAAADDDGGNGSASPVKKEEEAKDKSKEEEVVRGSSKKQRRRGKQQEEEAEKAKGEGEEEPGEEAESGEEEEEEEAPQQARGSRGRQPARQQQQKQAAGRGAPPKRLRRGAASASASADQYDASLIGRRLQVYWQGDKAWFEGKVMGYRAGKHRVDYDDGDREWLNLSEEKHKLLDDQRGQQRGKGRQQQQRGKGRQQAQRGRAARAGGMGKAAAAGSEDEDSDEEEGEEEEEEGSSSSGGGSGARGRPRSGKTAKAAAGGSTRKRRGTSSSGRAGRAASSSPAPAAKRQRAAGGGIKRNVSSRFKPAEKKVLSAEEAAEADRYEVIPEDRLPVAEVVPVSAPSGRGANSAYLPGQFYRSTNEGEGGRVLVMLALPVRDQTPPVYRIVRPNTGFAAKPMTHERLMARYGVCDPDSIEAAWHSAYESAAQAKGWGSRVRRYHLVVGAVLPVWGVLDRVAHQHGAKGGLKVMRVQLTGDSSQRLVGVVVPEGALEEIQLKLRQQQQQQPASKP